MVLLLITQSYSICNITNCFLTKSLKIMNMAAIFDFKIFTNAIDKYLDYEYVSWYFKMRFYRLYLKSYEKITCSMPAIWIANCGPQGQNPGSVMIVVK